MAEPAPPPSGQYTLEALQQLKGIGAFQPGGLSSDVQPIVIGGNIIGYNVQGQFLTPEEVQALIQTGRFPETGGGGGGGRAPMVQPPDPLGVARTLLEQYSQAVAAGRIPEERALADFQARLAQAQGEFDRWSTTQGLGQEQYATQVGEMAGKQAEATRRGQVALQDFYPSALPGMSSIDVPYMGNVPLSQVNLQELLSQGLPPLSQMQAPPQGVPAPPVPQWQGLPPDQTPPMADISQYLQQANLPWVY